MPSSELPVKPNPISSQDCIDNYSYWLEQIDKKKIVKNFEKTLDFSSRILPAHTFADRYLKPDKTFFRPLLSIFGYDERTKQFIPNSNGLLALRLRKNSSVAENHMTTSKKLGHDIFVFAYHGVHNPYHRKEDTPPIKPFGLFIKKSIEVFADCHGSPCDIVEKNSLVDRNNLKRYYLLPEHLRALKANEICYKDLINNDFWYYFGDPLIWNVTEEYGNKIYEKTGEFRYLESIPTASIEAILWPCDTDKMLEGNIPNMDDDLDLYNSFKRVFPDISIIEYNLIEGDENNWALALVEASFYSTKYYLEHDRYPIKARFAKIEFQNE